MLNIFREIILGVIRESLSHDEQSPSLHDILIGLPNENRGDLYTNAAMIFAKRIGANPRELATRICNELLKSDFVASAEVAGPGFVNFNLNLSAWHAVINLPIKYKNNYSVCNIGKNEKVNVEFVSANPTGPLHTGHARNAVFGSVVANLLQKIGYLVTKEFYINDMGNQVKSLARSVYLRYKEKLGYKIQESDFTDDMYIGEYVKDIAESVVQKYGNSMLDKEEDQYIEELSNFSIKNVMDNILDDLDYIGVKMDVFTSEKEVCTSGTLEEAFKILTEKGCIYDGVIDKPKGIDIPDWEPRKQKIFASTKYGDDLDRPVQKSDGSNTYFAGDIAYHLDKIKRGFMKMINILGADHNGYVKRLQAAVSALSDGKAEVSVKLYQLVNFLENGVPVRMSKRSGNFITLREVVDRVGRDATRFMMISRDHNVMIDFDFVKVCEYSMENPLFYIQYAYARICSVFKYSLKIWPEINDDMLVECSKCCLTDKAEIDLIKLLCFWPDHVSSAAKSVEPHKIPYYLREIAAKFHALWNAGKLNTALRFIDERDKDSTMARLALLKATASVIEDGFAILGITPMQEMR